MPEYLAPAVYIEETSFRAKSIEGVSTSTTGFAGPTLTGPEGGTPNLLTSFADFERIYGGLDDLDFGATVPATNYLAHAVRAYFNEGGSRLYVSRAVPAGATGAEAEITPGVSFVARFPGRGGNGTITVEPALSPATLRSMRSAPPGTVLVGDATPAALRGSTAAPFDLSGANATLRLALGQPARNVSIRLDVGKAEVTAVTPLAAPAAPTQLEIVLNGVKQPGIALRSAMPVAEIIDVINSHLQGGYARLDAGALVIGAHLPSADARVSVVVKANAQLSIADTVGAANVTDLTEVTVEELDRALRGADIRAVANGGMVTLQTTATGSNARLAWTGGVQDALGLGATAADGSGAARTFLKKDTGWFDAGDNAATGLPALDDDPAGNFVTLTVITRDGSGREVLYEGVGLDPRHPRWIGGVLSEQPTRQAEYLQRLYAIHFDNDPAPGGLALYGSILDQGRRRSFTLAGGSDGAPPSATEYADALEVLSGIEDISIIAAPGSSAYETTIARGARNALVSAAEKRRAYRIAVLDTPPEQLLAQARAWRGEVDSKHAALYYPWVVVPNPLARAGDDRIPKEIALPPSGFVSGIYARNDVERGVFKAPANEVVRSALRFELDVNFAQQEVLNPLGVNCLRFFPGRGYRVWGARTASSDPEWKYLSVRRYFNFIERSIDVGTQWAVFEPNGERLWANIRETISSFLETQWRSGALLGTDPKQAYFVRCDRSTMTQDDLDNGRLICLVGVAVVKPAEFVIFRIGQKTADARN